MHINWITIYTDNLENSMAFYRDYLGLKIARELSPGPGMKIVFFATQGSSQIEIIEDKNTPQTSAPKGVSLGLGTSDYDALLKKARELNLLQGEPMVLGGHLECFFVKDPNGVDIQIARK